MAETTSNEFLKEHMPLFDSRVYRQLELYNDSGGNSLVNTFYPHYDYGSFASEFHETPESIQKILDEGGQDISADERRLLEERRDYIKKFMEGNNAKYLAQRSFIHPYALVKLAGSYGSKETLEKRLTYDMYNSRKYYEIDGDPTFSGNYSKSPTTTTLIRWGSESKKGTTPYSFQDFAFCKWWNKIENNRLITLRRYAMPVTDNIEFPDYDVSENGDSGDNTTFKSSDGTVYKGSDSKSPFVPLATAVTYFGEGTGNSLSTILSFSAKYNWKSIGEENKTPIDISTTQSDAGMGLVSNDFMGGAVTSGLGTIAKTFGFLGEVANSGKSMNLEGSPGSAPPDPYKNGPYENRILGPVNVITKTWRRERGLEFTQDGLSITFEYVARPIAGVNNKAVILDLLSNMLILTYSSGSWFGGMWRYRASGNPALYPFKYGDAMNKMYKGQLFGKNGAVASLTSEVFKDGGNLLTTFLPDAVSAVSSFFNGAMNSIKSLFTKDANQKAESEDAARSSWDTFFQTGTVKAIQKVIAAKALKGTTVPFIQGQRALLTGEPVGDWHLTIGNPLNPIAMIGNLIVKDFNVTFSDELGPDDFPIGFKAVIKLDHGLGRDRDAIESMFNRGFGRIYTLDDRFRSSADGETKVDNYTGGQNTSEGRLKYDEVRNTYYGGGTAFIAAVQQSPLSNKGSIYMGDTQSLSSLKPTSEIQSSQSIAKYYVNPWQMGYTL